MHSNTPSVTHEIAPVPHRGVDAHKGDVGRIVIIGGCHDETVMIGAPALAANAAFRSGAGLVELLVPAELRKAVGVLTPCATLRTVPVDVEGLLEAVAAFRADVVVMGPGLGHTLSPDVVAAFLTRYEGSIVLDADGLNRLSEAGMPTIPDPGRVMMTPHEGEMRRLLGIDGAGASASRRDSALELVERFGCTVVLKGRGTVVTNGERMYVNETGNAGMATGGSGDVLGGVIAALVGQRMAPFEGAILGVYLHGLAGDFAAEELGRCSMTALDLIDYLAEAFCDHEMSGG